MTVDDAEVVFGKRWKEWSPAETLEFVEVLEPEELNVPFTINLAITHQDRLQAKTRDRLARLASGAFRSN